MCVCACACVWGVGGWVHMCVCACVCVWGGVTAHVCMSICICVCMCVTVGELHWRLWVCGSWSVNCSVFVIFLKYGTKNMRFLC